MEGSRAFSIQGLESLLRQRGESLLRLQRNELDFGRRLSERELDEAFDDIAVHVEEYLDCVPEECGCEYRENSERKNFYERAERMIVVQRLREASLLPTLAHEYAHHIQYGWHKTYPQFRQLLHAEGHARRVERHIATVLAQERGNDAFLWQITNEDVAEIKSAYLWTCERLKTCPDQELLQYKTQLDAVEATSRKKRGRPSAHALGNTLYQLGSC